MPIVQLPPSTVKLINSTQIITSVSSVVKELMENSLDADATSVDVKLVNNGLDRIEVKDNGSGISNVDTCFMALPSYTSKISSFNDLDVLCTYGFRGEALHALCQVGQVSVTTATAADTLARTYTLDSGGNVTGARPSHHSQGTTVAVTNLFKNLPVRRQYVGSGRRAQEELKLVEVVVKSLAVIKPKIRVTLVHNKCLIWQKTSCLSLQSSFSQMIGYTISQHLELVCRNISNQISIEFLIPQRNSNIELLSKSTPCTSLVFINQRMVTYKKILKALHRQLSLHFGDKFPSRKYAICVMSISTSPSNLDVNLNPSKTEVLLKEQDTFLSEVEEVLKDYYNPAVSSQSKDYAQGVEKPPKFHEHDFDGSLAKRRKLDGDDVSSEKAAAQHDTYFDVNRISSTVIFPHFESNIDRDLGDKSEAGEGRQENMGISYLGNSEKYALTSTLEAASNALANTECVGEMFGTEISPPSHSEETISTESRQNKLHSFLVIDATQESERNEGNERRAFVSDVEKSSSSLEGGNSAGSSEKVSVEAWSMGQLQGTSGDLIQGACVFVPGVQSKTNETESIRDEIFPHVFEIGSDESESVPPGCLSSSRPLRCESATLASGIAVEKNLPEISKNISPKRNIKKGPRVLETVNGAPLDSSLHSVSSQMGRRELAAFTKFARDARPQIILQNPGISFTRVASMLADRWRTLTLEEKEEYEEMARQTASNRKVWQTFEKQKKLDWADRAPSQQEKSTENNWSKVLFGKKVDRKELACSFSIDCIKDIFLKADTSRALSATHLLNSTGISLLGQLEPSGSWLCLNGPELCLLSHYRLQEVVVNHRLLETFALPLRELPVKEEINREILGEESWKILLSLENKTEEFKFRVITSDVISKNGFRIEIHEDGRRALLTHVAETINFYGQKEVQETLDLVKLCSHVKLSECRPLRAVNHIKSEAMRICRKSSSIIERRMMEELLQYWQSVMEYGNRKCLHFEPILTPIFNFSERKQCSLSI